METANLHKLYKINVYMICKCLREHYYDSSTQTLLQVCCTVIHCGTPMLVSRALDLH